MRHICTQTQYICTKLIFSLTFLLYFVFVIFSFLASLSGEKFSVFISFCLCYLGLLFADDGGCAAAVAVAANADNDENKVVDSSHRLNLHWNSLFSRGFCFLLIFIFYFSHIKCYFFTPNIFYFSNIILCLILIISIKN